MKKCCSYNLLQSRKVSLKKLNYIGEILDDLKNLARKSSVNLAESID
jgi:hypothetical protein